MTYFLTIQKFFRIKIQKIALDFFEKKNNEGELALVENVNSL